MSEQQTQTKEEVSKIRIRDKILELQKEKPIMTDQKIAEKVRSISFCRNAMEEYEAKA